MPLNQRDLKSELLDELDPEDPDAKRSRRDLRRINLFMGNMRWIRVEILKVLSQTDTKLNIIEKIDDWSYIELKNGNKGWLTSSSYRLIR